MATVRDDTATGRGGTSANSHHQTSPRTGRPITTRCGFPEGAHVAPLVRSVDWLIVVGRIAGIDLRIRVSGEQCSAAEMDPHLPRVLEQLIVNRRAYLDSERGAQVVEMLANEIRTKGRAGIMVTHGLRMVDFTDRSTNISDGSLI
jgi:hypothetical protein